MTFLDQFLDIVSRNTQVEPEPEDVDESTPSIFDDVDRWLYETAHFFDERSVE